MVVKIVYIDDDDQDRRKYKAKFLADARSRGKFVVETVNTPKSLTEYKNIIQMNPDLLFVDYVLDIPEGDKVIGVSGVALSTELRQKCPGVPIVLFTRKSMFGRHDYINTKETLSSIIDEIIYKQDLFKQDSLILENIYRIADGYNILRNQKDRTWGGLLGLIGASKSDQELLEQSNPPFPDIKRWSTTSIAVWIRDILLRFPGILYDAVHAATLLGISKEAFLSETIQKTFASARYAGIF